ncbi:MAG: YcxB family protein [Lentisphaerae bacterium]|nr:YcxB family protein [Lentisphaerota bacterium]
MITVIAQPEFEDYLRAQRHHGRARMLVVAGILGAMGFFVWLMSGNLLLPAFVALYLVALRPLYMHLRLKRQWRQTPSAHRGQRTCILDEIGFHSEDDEGTMTVTHWDKFLKFRSSRHSFFLYLSPNMYLYLPRRFMSSSDQEATQKLLTESIGS